MIRDGISFINFLDHRDHLQDATIVWVFHERLQKTEKDRIIWNKLRDKSVRNIRIF